jgi:2-dehydro-3-deoxygalactonokinase
MTAMTSTPHAAIRPLVMVDWGTSSLRAAFASDDQVEQTRHSDQGILKVPAGAFPRTLHELCGDWLQAPEVLCLISGMAGSAQGWSLAPYCPCPAGQVELAQHLHWIEPQRIALVPGLSCELAHAPDVMRGEEVQILGVLQLHGLQDAQLVLPGTHSKWVTVRAGRIDTFNTYMTGEVYAVMRQHSILGRTLPAWSSDETLDDAHFDQGVRLSLQGGSLLHHLFGVRTLSLMDRAGPAALASYLSGLVIGEELRAQHLVAGQTVWVVGSTALQARYQRALALLGVSTRPLGDTATWTGLMSLAAPIRRRSS